MTTTLPSGAILKVVVPSNQATTVTSTATAKRKLETDHEEEDELEVLNTRVSLIDPISGGRISYCCKSLRCDHVGCFEFDTFVKLHSAVFAEEKKPPEKVFDRKDKNRILRYSLDPVPEKTPKKKRRTSSMGTTDSVLASGAADLKETDDIDTNNTESPWFTVYQHVYDNNKVRQFTYRKTPIPTMRNEKPPYRCPVCHVAFWANELIFDDWMYVLMSHPSVQTARQVEIGSDGRARAVTEEVIEDKGIEIVELSEAESVVDDEDFMVFLPNGTEEDPVVLD